ncbi:MRC [Mytilus coruscus]|uniref:MRC n=1 Tax=Mytilus coruscus TaxID=42192 RepID=A0A6J8EG57_MYTCO|nr:MRC [Mytilus coruscus]
MNIYWMMSFIGYVCASTYKLIPSEVSWQEARDLCMNDNDMDLVVINDNDVMTEVEQYMNTFVVLNFDIWIGLFWNASRQKFIWVNNEKLSWTPPWYSSNNEPNCMESSNVYCDPDYPSNENCVRIGKSLLLFEWKTHGCDKTHGVLCQSLPSTTSDVPATTESSTTDLSTTVKSTSTDSTPTTTMSFSTITTGTNMSAKSTQILSTTSQTQLATEPAKTKPTSIIEFTEQPIITINTKFITSNRETSSETGTEYTTFGTVFNNTQLLVCTCKSITTGTNSPTENYRIEKRSTSAYIRRHISIHDGRLSSIIIGYTGAVVICVVVFFVVSIDIINILKKQRNN